MRAWEVREGILSLREVQSRHPRTGETLLRVNHIGICGSDRPKLRCPTSFALPESWRPGHEIVGTDTTGRTFAVSPLVPCNACQNCETGDIHLCATLRRLGWDLPGGFAEEVILPPENAHHIPDDLDPLHAVLADPAAVAIHGLRCCPVGAPGRVAVIGAGTIGMLTALYAHEQGWEVNVLHRECHPPSDATATAQYAEFRSPASLHHKAPFDLVVDAATGADAGPLDLALQLVSDGGTIIVQNAYHPGVRLPVPLRDLFRRSIRLIGSFSYCRRQGDDFAFALNLLRSNAGRIAHLVSEAGELQDLPAVLADDTTRSVRQVLTIRDA